METNEAVYVVGFYGYPLEYCDGYHDGNIVLVHGNFGTIFPTENDAKEAIRISKAYAKKQGLSTKKGEPWGSFKVVSLIPKCDVCGDAPAMLHYCSECYFNGD